MRCDDLTRELASPTGVLDPAEMAGHLAACPACAERSRRAARFDRAWEATRPAGPSMDALDTLWAHASAALDARAIPAPATIPFERVARRRWAMAAFVAAQAAAVLVAGVVLLRAVGRDDPVEVADATPAQAPAVVGPVSLHLVLEPDEQLIVRLDEGNRPRVEKSTRPFDLDSSSLPADTPHDEVGAMEAAGSSWGPSVASTQ